MEKGLNEAVNVFTGWINQVLNILLSTVLLPFRLVDALLD